MSRRVDGHIRQQISTTNAIGVISDIIAKDLNFNQIAEKWKVNHQTIERLINLYDKPIPKKIANRIIANNRKNALKLFNQPIRIYTLYDSIIPSIERNYA